MDVSLNDTGLSCAQVSNHQHLVQVLLLALCSLHTTQVREEGSVGGGEREGVGEGEGREWGRGGGGGDAGTQY